MDKLDMNVCTSAIDKGIRILENYSDAIKQLTRALKNNFDWAHSKYDDVNYREALRIVSNIDRTASDAQRYAHSVESNMKKLKARVDDYNETGYRG